jgi:hypothetical protein
MGKAAVESSTYPFAGLFRKQVPDLSSPDPEGWSSGTCPYCGLPGAFRANIFTGKWACLPEAATAATGTH